MGRQQAMEKKYLRGGVTRWDAASIFHPLAVQPPERGGGVHAFALVVLHRAVATA